MTMSTRDLMDRLEENFDRLLRWPITENFPDDLELELRETAQELKRRRCAGEVFISCKRKRPAAGENVVVEVAGVEVIVPLEALL